MVKQAAKVIGLLTTLIVLVSWLEINRHLPGSVGFGVTFIVFLGSILAGLFTYVTVIQK